MKIVSMFVDDINRKINGVIKVDQEDDTTEREVREYVITKELKKHFTSFFNYYGDAFREPTDDIGVWISGFFGSGKSHFLKMLSYLLENRVVNGMHTVERFREKFENDPGTFILIDAATKGVTETILFNIDIEGSINKDKTAVLRVFAKMFYNHLGFYGDNLKVATLEQYIERNGKTSEFRRVFEQKKGKPWTEMRRAFAFNGKSVIPTLMEVLDMSEEDARAWFHDKSSIDFSIAQLVADICDYITSKPADFRLLFMIDEVGQYVGTDTDMLLNLQSIVEKIGSECGGKVWIVCTGQEAIDEIIKVRMDEFSRIQARFKTRLSLSSSAVDEVIQKRILRKTPEAAADLKSIYDQNEPVLRNLFSFTDSILDIKGYAGAKEFTIDFPFVPYQFILLQKAFTEIRKHGNAGKHHSGAERSMLSGFQETAQQVQELDEYALVPFFRFYDTVHGFLDGSIRRVIERCERAAADGNGIESQDVDVLKLLYMIRYVQSDVPSTIDNIVILMASDIRTDKIVLREAVRNSLNRLLSQNYIGLSGNTYNFLTDEEQDIQREIREVSRSIDTATVVERISGLIYGDIYTNKKYRYGKYDFDFDKMVDGIASGVMTGGMQLRFLTIATDPVEKSELRLMVESQKRAIIVLAESPYYDLLQTAMGVRKYVKQRNVTQLAPSIQDIIRRQQDEAAKHEQAVVGILADAILAGTYYVDGEHLDLKPGSVSISFKNDAPDKYEIEVIKAKARSVIDQALEYLVSHVYDSLDLITRNAETDADILAILNGTVMPDLTGFVANRDAAAKMEDYLRMQYDRNLTTSMADIQSRYQAIPYGWREIDIALVTALLINDQKITVKYGGTTIQPDNPKLVDMLRKKSETGKATISIRVVISPLKMKGVRELLRDYFDIMDVPDDEDGLIAFVIDRFTAQKAHLTQLLSRYEGHNYPDKVLVQAAIHLIDDVLSQQKDNAALIERLLKQENPLLDSKEAMANVDDFFKNQVVLFDAAAKLVHDLSNELDYLAYKPEANQALNQLRLITRAGASAETVYARMPELTALMQTVRDGHGALLASKREEILEIVRQCMAAIHSAAGIQIEAKNVITKADVFYEQKKQRIGELASLALLDGLVPPMLNYKDEAVAKLEWLNKPHKPQPPKPGDPSKPVSPKKIIKAFNRQIVFPAKQLESEAEIDDYVEKIRQQLKSLMKNCDGIRLN